MFGTNEVGSYRMFDDEPKDTLKVTSLFMTCQGEGPFAGRPAIFLRLAKCNLQCAFCDTYFDSGSTESFEAIELSMRLVAANGYKYFWKNPLLVITGGEPMMQPNIIGFCEYIAQQITDLQIQIETNGCFFRPLRPSVHIVCSPKINEKRGLFTYNQNALDRANTLKFVISADIAPYSSIPNFALYWRDEKPLYRRIYVSPMNMYIKQPDIPSQDSTPEERAMKEHISFWTPGLLDMTANQRNHEYAAEIAMRYNATLSIQQHLYASLP